MDKGRLLACSRGREFTRDALAAQGSVAFDGITPVGGAVEYLIQYISEGPRGTPRRISAALTIPTEVAGPVPLVSFAHGTTGMGTGCGITYTLFQPYVDYVQFPLAAAGYATVSTDYENLGVPDGAHPYSVGQGEADNVLDAIRAARAFHDATGGSLLTDEVFVVGHSQGGHASLFAHQLYDVAGTRLLGSVSFAPAFGVNYGTTQLISSPSTPTDDFTGFLMMILYGHASYWEIPLTDWLTPDAAAEIPMMAATQCLYPFSQNIRSRWSSNAGIFTSSFMQAASTCAFDGSPCPQFQPWADKLNASLPGRFHSDVPALMLQGSADDVVAPVTVACIQAELRAHNTHVDTCYYQGLDHTSVAGTPLVDAVSWMNDRRAGRPITLPCEHDFTMACPTP